MSKPTSRHRAPDVVHLVVASQLPPRAFANADVEAVQDLVRYVPEDLREEADLVEMLLPILAADLNLLSGYAYSPDVCLDVPLTVVHCARDTKLRRADIDGWRSETTGPSNVREMAGSSRSAAGRRE